MIGSSPATPSSLTVSAETGPHVEVEDRRPEGPDERDPEPPGATASELAALLSAVLAAEGVSSEAVAGLHLVGTDEIAGLAVEHLGADGPTDVLSFPLDGAEAPAESEGGGEEGSWMVGDVVVCPSIALLQAEAHAGGPADELRLMVVHGGLHLCGWDHATDDERDAMWARERELMDELGVTPSADPWSTP